jgi:hypothetical protein
MALWGRADQANNAPKMRVVATGNAFCNAAFANTTLSAFVSGQKIGVYGANTAEAQSTAKGTGPGWIRKVEGTGPVASISLGTGATPGGNGYSNTDTVRISGGSSNATATLTTNATGGIQTLTLTSGGAGFVNLSNTTVAVINASAGASAGTGANVAITLGGKAGRVLREQLVAMRGAAGGTTNTNSVLS